MKLSISNIGWKSENDLVVYDLMKEYGFTGLEIAPTRIITENPYDNLLEAKKFKNFLWKNYSFSIPSMQSIWYGRSERIFGKIEEREKLIEYTKKAIVFAYEIGCHNLVFGCPKNRATNSDGDYEIAKIFFKELGEYAISKNVCIGMEANPNIYNTNFINDTASALKLIEDVNSDGFLLNLDIGTIIYNNEILDILKGKVHLINHIHISEPYLRNIERRNIHNELKELLIKENYKKFISIEVGTTDDILTIEKTMKYISGVFL